MTERDREGIPAEVVQDLLDAPRRRRMLAELAEADEPLVMWEVATRVLAAERDVARDTIENEAIRRTRDDLYEEHLPRLTATGVVEYDSMRETLTLESRAIETALE